jgi:general secretion pathway protein G
MREGSERGFSLIEMLVALVVVGLLAAIAITSYVGAIEKARITRTIAEIRTIEKEIVKFELDHDRLPDSLGEIGWGHLDVWGHPYQYSPFDDSPGKGAPGHARKDRWLVPLNTDFDLYSSGPDGASRPPLTAEASHDDIIRAGNGAYVGLASEY